MNRQKLIPWLLSSLVGIAGVAGSIFYTTFALPAGDLSKRFNWNSLPWLIIAIAVLVVIAFFAFRGCRKQKDKATDLATIIKIKHDTVYHYKDAQGLDHGRVRLAEADMATLKAAFPDMGDVLKTLKIQEKQIQALTAMSVRTSGEVTPIRDTVFIDNKAVTRWSYGDKYLQFEALGTDPPAVKYSTFDSFIVTTYWKRKNIFSKKETFVDAYSLNPNARISGLTGLRVAVERPKRFSVGAFGGYGTNGKEWSPVVGAGVQISLFSF